MIVKCDKKFFFDRCRERGYDIDNAMPCVISKRGDQWEIDTKHPKYPKLRIYSGPGTELKKLLSIIGIKSKDGKEGCKCSDRAKHMDYMEQAEPGWCERNIDEIVGWLQEESQKRRLPFFKTIARKLIKLAIKRSKQKSNCV